ncbi:MAG: hypothetical protein R3F60_05785 [bacterium]
MTRALEGTGDQRWIAYTGPRPAVASAILRDLAFAAQAPVLPDPEVERTWAELSDPVRAWVAEGIDLGGVVPTATGARVPFERYAEVHAVRRNLNGIGTFWVAEGRLPVVESGRCGRLEAGDRLFTARWSMPGYTGGQCSGAGCPDRLERAVQKARSVGERLQVTLTVARGGDAGTRLDIGCRVAP